MPPEDTEHYKVPGIFFSKPCNLFKKSFCWYSTQQTSAISLFLRYVLLLTVTACSYCCLMLIVTTEKQRKSQAKSHLSLNTLSADFCNSFYFLCSAAAWCWLLLPAPNYICKLFIFFLWSPPTVWWCCLLIRTTATHITREVRHTHAAFTRCLCELPWKRGDVVGHLGILGTATAIIVTFMFYWFFRIAPQGDALQQGTEVSHCIAVCF